MEAVLLMMLKQMPVSQVAYQVGEHDAALEVNPLLCG